MPARPAGPSPTAVFSHLRIAFLSSTTASSCTSPRWKAAPVSVPVAGPATRQAPGGREHAGGLGLACQVLQVERGPQVSSSSGSQSHCCLVWGDGLRDPPAVRGGARVGRGAQGSARRWLPWRPAAGRPCGSCVCRAWWGLLRARCVRLWSLPSRLCHLLLRPRLSSRVAPAQRLVSAAVRADPPARPLLPCRGRVAGRRAVAPPAQGSVPLRGACRSLTWGRLGNVLGGTAWHVFSRRGVPAPMGPGPRFQNTRSLCRSGAGSKSFFPLGRSSCRSPASRLRGRRASLPACLFLFLVFLTLVLPSTCPGRRGSSWSGWGRGCPERG